jgi:glucose-6-phosphate 1-dehydrogenase
MMIIIFGSTGDLTKRKLIPALFSLYQRKIIGADFPIVCVGRKRLSKNDFIDHLELKKFIPEYDPKDDSRFIDMIYYYTVDLDCADCTGFKKQIGSLEKKHKTSDKIFYLALPSTLFKKVVDLIKSCGLTVGKGYSRVVFEKPIGHDLRSAVELNDHVSCVFPEKSIYRIDHYLGKELVQNIMALRFSNAIFNEVWNNKFIDHVQITNSETVGIEDRGDYYEKTGAIKDMFQNHLLQILSFIVMCPPKSISADDIRDEKIKVLRSLDPVRAEDIVVGQYDSGFVKGRNVLPYRSESEVDPKSKTETYAAMKLFVNNGRWKGVPFYLRTGKRLAMRYTEVNVVLKDVSCNMFCKSGVKEDHTPNIMTIRIQPDEGIALTFNAKHPGSKLILHPVVMDFCHACHFGFNVPQAYEVLLHQIIIGDQTLFTRRDEIEESWRYIDPIVKMVGKKKRSFPNYEPGSFGPKEADKLIGRDGREWILPKELRTEHGHNI